MNKIAKLRVPFEKIEEFEKVWLNWFATKDTGCFKVHTYEDERAWMRCEKVFVIEGDSDVINPVITLLMEVLTRRISESSTF